jgi:hypothetical protein
VADSNLALPMRGWPRPGSSQAESMRPRSAGVR